MKRLIVEEKSVRRKAFWRKATLPLFVWVSLVYWELLLILGNGTPFFSSTLLYIAVFSAAGAAVICLLSTIFANEKANLVILTVTLTVIAVFFGVEYFCKVFFGHYMSLKSVFGGAKGVVTGFFNVIVKLVLNGFWMVLLLLVPLVVLFLLRRFELLSLRGTTVSRIFAAAAVAVFLLAGRGLVGLSEIARTRYAANYEFNTATTAFGLGTSTRLDLQYLLFGNRAAQGFSYVDHPDSPPENDTTETPPDEHTDIPDVPEPINYGYNAVDIDFKALSQTEPNATVAETHAYVASLTPSRQNEYTGLFAGKNLIFLSAEAFSKEVISPELTPTLYRLVTKGIQFKDYYQPIWGGSTSTGEFSNLTGLVPVYAVDSMLETVGKNMYYTPGNQLQRLGYFSRAYHPHTYDYYDRDLTHENLGYEKYIGYGNGLEDRITWQWPESDLELMEATVDEYIDHQPFSIYYMTVSGHANYNWYGNYMSAKYHDIVADLDTSEGVKAYIACTLELEKAMTYLIDRLEAAGIADDTVIVLGTDHYPYGLELEPSDRYATALGDLYGYDWSTPWERDHSALILWSGCLEDRDPIVVDTPVYSLDILPTLSNLMGFTYDSRLLVGRDVFSDTPPLVLWVDYSWMTDKASYNSSTGEVTVFPGHEGEVDDDYVSAVKRLVSNKFSFSKNVLDTDYYNILFG